MASLLRQRLADLRTGESRELDAPVESSAAPQLHPEQRLPQTLPLKGMSSDAARLLPSLLPTPLPPPSQLQKQLSLEHSGSPSQQPLLYQQPSQAHPAQQLLIDPLPQPTAEPSHRTPPEPTQLPQLLSPPAQPDPTTQPIGNPAHNPRASGGAHQPPLHGLTEVYLDELSSQQRAVLQKARQLYVAAGGKLDDYWEPMLIRVLVACKWTLSKKAASQLRQTARWRSSSGADELRARLISGQSKLLGLPHALEAQRRMWSLPCHGKTVDGDLISYSFLGTLDIPALLSVDDKGLWQHNLGLLELQSLMNDQLSCETRRLVRHAFVVDCKCLAATRPPPRAWPPPTRHRGVPDRRSLSLRQSSATPVLHAACTRRCWCGQEAFPWTSSPAPCIQLRRSVRAGHWRLRMAPPPACVCVPMRRSTHARHPTSAGTTRSS